MNPKEKISKYFTLEELIRTSPANEAKLKALSLNNLPNAAVVTNLTTLAKVVLDPVREFIGGPLAVTSGYRSPKLNEIIGGAPASQHMVGCAVDVDAHVHKVGTNAQIFWCVINRLDFDQVIWEFGTDQEPDWVHISYISPTHNRRKALKAVKEKGKTVYKPYDI